MAFERGVEQAIQLFFYDKNTGDLADPGTPVIEYFKDGADAESINANRLVVKTGKGYGVITLTAEEMTCDMGSITVTSTNCRPATFSFHAESKYTAQLADDLGTVPEAIAGIDTNVDVVVSGVEAANAALDQRQGASITTTRTE